MDALRPLRDFFYSLVRPMFSLYAALAERAYPRRWQLGALTLAGMLVFPLAALLGALWEPLFLVLAALAGSFVAVLWGSVLAGVWFHPAHGYLAAGSFVGRLPAVVSLPVRALFATFLALWFLFGVLAWPIFALSRAWD